MATASYIRREDVGLGRSTVCELYTEVEAGEYFREVYGENGLKNNCVPHYIELEVDEHEEMRQVLHWLEPNSGEVLDALEDPMYSDPQYLFMMGYQKKF